jgi:hypothetical protein
MSVQLKELLSLEILNEFSIVAGLGGLTRRINKVGILDYEFGDVINSNFKEGELVLTNLMLIKEDISQLEDIIRRLIDSGTGGLAIKKLYFDTLPEAVIDLANAYDFPIFFYQSVYYEDIITELVTYINNADRLSDQVVYIKKLKSEALETRDVQQMAYKLNPEFKPYVCAVMVRWKNVSDAEGYSAYHASQILGRHHVCLKENTCMYILMSFDDTDVKHATVESAISSLGVDGMKAYVGYSSVRPIEFANTALIEADHANLYHQMMGGDSLQSFETLGLYQILMPLYKEPYMELHYMKIAGPILDYDARHGSDLMKTATAYIESGCDIKQTAKELFQHGNTIRYRLERIRSILEDVCESRFVDQELTIAVRIHKLKRFVG